MKVFNVGIIGVGSRGFGWVKVLAKMENIRIRALCDVNEERLQEKAAELKAEFGVDVPLLTGDYREVIDFEEVCGRIYLLYGKRQTGGYRGVRRPQHPAVLGLGADL